MIRYGPSPAIMRLGAPNRVDHDLRFMIDANGVDANRVDANGVDGNGVGANGGGGRRG